MDRMYLESPLNEWINKLMESGDVDLDLVKK